jgi:Penicillin-insensitive murein endopeptidase
MPIACAAPHERSKTSPGVNGPRSLTVTRTFFPLLEFSTTRQVPKGRLYGLLLGPRCGFVPSVFITIPSRSHLIGKGIGREEYGNCCKRKEMAFSGDDGCGVELDDWFKKLRQAEMQSPGTAPAKPPLTLDDLPAECRTVLAYGRNKPNADLATARALKWTTDKPAGPPPPHCRVNQPNP